MPADWPFEEPEHLAVFTFQRITRRESPVLLVTHDAADGAWQFLDGGEIALEEEAALVSLLHMTQLDPSLLQLADLPAGWIAWRDHPDDPWRRAPADAGVEEKIRSDVERVGWHVLLVAEDESGPPFGYTIGLFKTFGQPELTVFGLTDPDMLHQLLNILGEAVRQGRRFAEGDSASGFIEGFDIRFVEVERSQYAQHLGYASWFYQGQDYPVLQCLWPDAAGRYPSDPDFDATLRTLQPLLRQARGD